MDEKKEQNVTSFPLYCKLLAFRILQAMRLMSFFALLAFSGVRVWNHISVYKDIKVSPGIQDMIILGICIIGLIVLSTIKEALNDKVSDVTAKIQQNRHLMQRKAELRLKYTDKIAEESIRNEQQRDYGHNGTSLGDLMPVRKFDVQKIKKEDAHELDNMIGLESVKEQLKRVRARIAYEKKHGGASQKNVMHCRFVGSPGTGKTTVAKAMAAILYDAGIIKKPRYVEINANALQGKYLGETPLVVNELFKQAAGGLIFIDEAYALASCAGSSDKSGYAMEAVTTLLTHLENNYSETVVIFAGYEDEIERLFDMNPGLRSRVPIKLEFADYNSNQLLQILEINLKKRGHTLAEDAKPFLLNLFAQKIQLCQRERCNFGNGRYARNVSDELHTQHSVNYEDNHSIGTCITLADIIPERLLALD